MSIHRTTYIEPTKELDALAHAVIGAAIEVHRHLGPGFLESVYEEALCVELDLRGIAYERNLRWVFNTKDRPLGKAGWTC